eukprot:817252-Pyramimonas_sp.AAC.1
MDSSGGNDIQKTPDHGRGGSNPPVPRHAACNESEEMVLLVLRSKCGQARGKHHPKDKPQAADTMRKESIE